jgi:hypothetical protein
MCLVSALLVCAGAHAASTKSTILGTVQDSSSALVPNATVTIRSETTNFVRQANTNPDGDYVVPDLDPGTYSITVEAPGFKRFARTGVLLNVDRRLRVDAALSVGDVTETVQVAGEAPLVETDSSAIGQVIARDQVNRLPLNGRSFLSLALLVPGSNQGYPGNRQQANELGGVSLAVNGARSTSNNYMIDGVDNNGGFNGYFSLSPSIDSIEEFKVQTNSYSAEFGRSAGAQINVVTRTGTNQFHGSAFEYLRNSELDAVSFFSKAGGITTKPPFKQNQFGATLGGAIIKNSTFFFFSYEGTRIRQALTRTSTVPSAAMRGGDFSGLATIYDPFNLADGLRQPFPGNRIPDSRISAASRALQAYVPLPNAPGTAGNFIRNAPYKDGINQTGIRIDQKVKSAGQLFGRFTYSHREVVGPSFFGTPAIGGGSFSSGVTETDDPRIFAVGYTHVFRPNLVNEIRAGYNRFVWLYYHDNQGNDIAKEVGIQGLPGDPAVVGFPLIGITGFTQWGDGGFLPNNTYPDETYQLIDNLTWIKGKHTLKAGIDFRRNHRYFITGSAFRGSFSFSGIYSRQTAATPGTPYADFLLGFPAGANRTVGTNVIYSQSWFHNFFLQDDFKVSRRLTLNLGLRYELNSPYTEKFNRISNFDIDTGTLVFADAKYITPGLTFPTGQAFSNSTVLVDKNNFAPRIGLAYRLTDDNHTVIRAGWGIFYNIETGDAQIAMGTNPPFQFNAALTGDPATPNLRYETAFATTPQFSGFPSIQGFQKDFRDGYLQHWELSLQRQLLASLMVEGAYVGSKGTHLITRNAENQPLPGPGAVQPRRPYPAFAGINMPESFASSIYHSMQLKAVKRLSQGLSFLTSYTWSKSIDNASDFSADAGPNPRNTGSYMRGPSRFDQTHRFVQSWLYEIPVGRGRSALSQVPIPVDWIVGGWNFGGIYTWGTGFPFTPTISLDQANNGLGGQRPDIVGDWRVENPRRELWYNPMAFALPAQYSFGNAGRNILRGPNFSNLDFSIMKRFQVTESHRVTFRAELFNAFNTANFGLPSGAIGTTSAGQIFGTVNPNRQIQLALRYEF